MLKIGEMARVARVSVKTLRFYADKGLLRPAWIDRFTGYRHYHVEQLERLHRILALKDLGLSLEQIQQLLAQDLPAAELHGMLLLKQAELQDQIRTDQSRLARVQVRLAQLEGGQASVDAALLSIESPASAQEVFMPEPQIVTRDAFAVVGLLYHGHNQEGEIPAMWHSLGPRIPEIGELSDRNAYGVCWPPDEDGAFDYLAGFAVAVDRQAPAGMVYRPVAGGTFAVFPCTIPTLGQAYHDAYQVWLPTSGYEYAGGSDYELYTEEHDPEDPSSLMYIYIPVRPKKG